MKYILAIFVIFCLATSCEQESASSSEENVVSPTVDPIQLDLRPATDAEIAELEKKYNLTVSGGNGENGEKLMGACRWSDDLTGATYGLVSCNGRCGVVTGGNGRIGIGCFDSNNNITSSGAYRNEQ